MLQIIWKWKLIKAHLYKKTKWYSYYVNSELKRKISISLKFICYIIDVNLNVLYIKIINSFFF